MTYVVTGSNDEIIAEFNTLKPRKAAGPEQQAQTTCLLNSFYILIRNAFGGYDYLIPRFKVLPEEQAGFRQNCCTLDQVALLTEDIEVNSFDKKLKTGVVLVDLSAAYDTVWHRRLTLKLLRTILSKEMIRVIISMISKHGFRGW